MKNIFINFALVLIILGITSCTGNEEEVFHTLQFDVDGISLSHNTQNGTFDGVLPSDGAVFTITGKGEFDECVYVSSIFIYGIPQEAEGIGWEWYPPHAHLGNRTIRGEWGEIKYLTTIPPYTIELKINPNKENHVREIDIQLGYGYWISHILLKQTAKPMNESVN